MNLEVILVEKLIFGLVSAALLWGAVRDWKVRQIPQSIGIGMLMAGLAFLLLRGQLLAAAFYVAAVWGSRGGLWRLPILVLAIAFLADGGTGAVPVVLGILYILSIFWLGWFGGGDAQIAFGLVALAGDWWILTYLFGGTILLAVIVLVRRRGLTGALMRLRQVFENLHSPDDEAIRIPWAVVAAVGGMLYIWIWPGGFWL